jgi:hypothetical protein
VAKRRQNKSPFAIALGDWFALQAYFLASQAPPNDLEIVVIVIIIVIGEAEFFLHIGGIIAQFFRSLSILKARLVSAGLETQFGKLYPVGTFKSMRGVSYD